MFGATMNSYTLFHTVEADAGVPYLYERKLYRLKTRDPSGAVRELPLRRQDMTVQRSFADMARWLEERRLLERRVLGTGELLFLPSVRAVHMVLLDALRTNPLFLTEPPPMDGTPR
jgi:hypothetical protein